QAGVGSWWDRIRSCVPPFCVGVPDARIIGCTGRDNSSASGTRQRHPQESVLIRGGRLVRLDGERKPHLGRERAVSDACNVVHAMVAVEWIGTRAFDGEDIILDHNVDVLPLHTSDL